MLNVICLITLFFYVGNIFAINNVCLNWADYWYGDINQNSNCSFNPDGDLEIPDLLQKYYGRYETHNILTEDGYNLTMFRVPRENSKGVIFFQHPAASDAIYWIGIGTQAPAYTFWSEGYEFWLPNTRGTKFSSKHNKFDFDDYKYWNFSFHEIAIFDLRQSIKYAHEYTKKKLIVMGHSMGSTEVLIYGSLFPTEAKRMVSVFVVSGPTASLKFSSLKILGQIAPTFQEFIERDKIGYIFGSDSVAVRIMRNICTKWADFCISMFSVFGTGWSTEKSNATEGPIIFNQYPRPISSKSLLHYLQILKQGDFRMFDYGKENEMIYGSRRPPEYPVWNITTPTYLIYGVPDELVPYEDVEDVYDRMPNEAKIYGKLRLDGFSHVDPLVAITKKEKIFDKVLMILSKIKN